MQCNKGLRQGGVSADAGTQSSKGKYEERANAFSIVPTMAAQILSSCLKSFPTLDFEKTFKRQTLIACVSTKL